MIWPAALWAALAAALTTGCAHSDTHKPEPAATSVAGIPAPPPPVFLSTALAPLFTNVSAFRAHVVLEGPPSVKHRDIVAGELMGRDGMLFFAPEPGADADQHSRSEDFSYLWSVEQDRGFLLNGPLQGYAPISSKLGFSNVVVTASGNDPAPEKAGGYLCVKSDVTAVASNGTESVFHTWRARELKGMPVRVTGTVNGMPLTLTLSKIRLESPPQDLFQPPADFTKYTSAEGMMAELAARQANQKRKRGWQPPPNDEIGFRDYTAPVAPH
jgi:hypothetical protein